MKVGVFSVIDWNFLDQRPQVLAKKIAEWGHDVVYIEPFTKLTHWSAAAPHEWSNYEAQCWQISNVASGINVCKLLNLPAHKSIADLMPYNKNYESQNKAFIKSLELDLAIVVDPCIGVMLDELDIPYIYDHVDDTHLMNAVINEFWYKSQQYCEKNAMISMYIQPNIAARYGGLYLPNGIDKKQLDLPEAKDKIFDAGVLSAIADWFDLESVMKTKKKILIIGPMEQDVLDQYNHYRRNGGQNLTWLPRVTRRIGAHWLKRCKTAIVPFSDEHPVVDYVMPLKLVEYLYLGLPSVSYLNKGIENEFGDVTTFYSSIGWRGLPDLDTAIDIASSRTGESKKFIQLAEKFTWDNVLKPLEGLLQSAQGKDLSREIFQELCEQHIARSEIKLVSKL
ncbi:MAG: hypothetical protein ABJN11_10510 [Lentilitoribacter sp.]